VPPIAVAAPCVDLTWKIKIDVDDLKQIKLIINNITPLKTSL
jgi:hypothetical protein